MYQYAIVRKPGKSMVNGLSTAGLGKPDFNLARDQHAKYIEALEKCGVEVIVLEADERYPDSIFVEDAAVLIPDCAVITRPGALSRRGEVVKMGEVLSELFPDIETVWPSGTLEGGDVMRVGDHFYIGLSDRTNPEGAEQLIDILQSYNFTGSAIEVGEALHLKTSVSYLENNTLVVGEVFMDLPEFQSFNKLLVPPEESYAANCIWVNGIVIIAAGFPKTMALIVDAGYPVIEVDVSEFRKLDGGLSCLSLRF